MPNIEKGSIDWLDKLDRLKEKLQANPNATKDELAKALDAKVPTIKLLIWVSGYFDTEAILRIRQASQANPPYILSLKSAQALIGLKGRVPDFSGALMTVLEKAISADLQTYQIKALVEWVVEGKAVQDFDPIQVKKPTKWDTPVRRPQAEGHDLGAPIPEEGIGEKDEEEPAGSHSEPAHLNRGLRLEAATQKAAPSQEPVKAKKASSTNWFEELLTGVSVTKPILKKARKGEPLTGGEWWLLIFHIVIEGLKKFSKAIKPRIRKAFRFYHQFFKKLANFIIPHSSSRSSGSKKSKSGSNASLDKPLQALAHWAVYVFCQLVFWDMILGLIPSLKPWLEWPVRWVAHEGLVVFPATVWAYAKSHLVPAIFAGILLGLALFGAFAKKPAQTFALILVLGLAWIYGRSWSDDLKLPSFFSKPTATVPAPVVASVPEQPKIEKHLTHTSSHSELVQPHVAQLEASQQVGSQAFNGDDEQKTLLEQSVVTLPFNRVIEPIPVTPDSSIGQLMAVNRVGDIAVESEYSLRIGQSGQKIASVTPSSTGLTIAIEGGLPLGGLLGGGSALGFYWEDVQTIYTCELDSKEDGKTKPLYYFFLYATNLNQPLVIQCNTTNNLNHLVSAFEYFIKAAQGKTVPVTVMPYLNQGLVLGDENKITALWAGSPADQAGLTFKDHVWSVSGSQPQVKADLESALQSLPSGKQTIEVVTGNDWQAARAKESREHNSKLEPKLTGVHLTIP